MSMVAQVFVRKTRMRMVEENSRKSLLITLDKNSPFDWKYLLSNMWRKTSEMNRKNWLKNSPKILVKTVHKPPNL